MTLQESCSLMQNPEGREMHSLCSLIPRPRPAFRRLQPAFPYCKRRKARQGLGTRLQSVCISIVSGATRIQQHMHTSMPWCKINNSVITKDMRFHIYVHNTYMLAIFGMG